MFGTIQEMHEIISKEAPEYFEAPEPKKELGSSMLVTICDRCNFE